MYRIAVCDDDWTYRANIRRCITELEFVNESIEYFEYESGEQMLAHIYEQHDLVFLDIQMPGLDGNETARRFRDGNQSAVLIFCTNYNSLTPELIKVRPFRYVMKDLNNKNLNNELPDILTEMMKAARIVYITVTGPNFIRRIPIKDILYIAILKHGAEIILYEGNKSIKIRCRETVRFLYERLRDHGFEYAHNSYIVNLSNIICKEKQIIRLKDNTELNVARSRKAKLEESMFEFFHARRYD